MSDKLTRYILKQISGTEGFGQIRQRIDSGKTQIVVSGLAGSSLSALIAVLNIAIKRPVCLVTSKRERAADIFDDLEFFGMKDVFHLPAWEILPYEHEEPHADISARSLDTYEALFKSQDSKPSEKKEAPVIVIPLEAAFQKMLSLDFYNEKCIRLQWGGKVDTDKLALRLASSGYERTPMVRGRGEFSLRGGIIDVFPPTEPVPVRLDLFGDEIESIRTFDPFTQRSHDAKSSLEHILLPPARLNEMMMQSLGEEIPLVSIFDNLPGDAVLIFDEEPQFRTSSHDFEELVERQYFEAGARGEEHPPPDTLYLDWETIEENSRRFTRLSHGLLPPVEEPPDGFIRFHTSSFRDFHPSLDKFMDVIRRKQAEDYLVCIVCDNEGQVMRFDELLKENEISAVDYFPGKESASAWKPKTVPGGLTDVVLCVGGMHEGFLFPEAAVALITDREIFGRYRRRHVYRKVYKGKPVSAPSEINRGDYVVHVEHGIGKFIGIRTQIIDEKRVDLIELVYADKARLLVPTDKIHLLQKYSVVQDMEPSLDELGSKKWLTRKKKTQEKIEKMAEELLNIYARREMSHGYVYGADTVWQSEFEASFIYDETPDQITAIRQVKKDLTDEKPMDRLVCGDVGYGKTEVALRAAFKVIQEKKQVAVLAPTTILCQQHYKTFSERFADYPFSVEMLSRFRTRSQQKKIVQKVKNGEVNIVVGTHRLLSKDVKFFDLGIVIVDEEQRFGVRHKERLKELRANVDFLTLTATPIPRTFYMALSGLRDLSIINTPPPNRLPIKTQIIHWDDEMIREAILRETNRGGQIYFVHNRIHNIEQVERRILDIVPDLKIAVAHGRMNEHELEQVMTDFIDQKYDMLLSTTIIENGLDIPNVNTIIINRADAMGLAQLYQLRGRVGRDVKRAYAYMITPSGQAITEAAIRRLAAIEEFTELGSGFNIAMRDLEIRGSGNLLGKEQHGCIISIGFDLYCSLLEKTVKRLKGEPEESFKPVEIKWGSAESFLPHEYIPMEAQRVGVYKRLSEAHEIEVIDDIREELRDRYGESPKPVLNLLRINELRILASKLGITRIILTAYGFMAGIEKESEMEYMLHNLKTAEKEIPHPIHIKSHDTTTLHILFPKWKKRPQLKRAVNLLSEMVKADPLI